MTTTFVIAAGFRPRGRPGDELPDTCKLYVGSLPDSVTDDTLRTEFSKFGEVLHAIVLKDMTTQMVRFCNSVSHSDDKCCKPSEQHCAETVKQSRVM